MLLLFFLGISINKFEAQFISKHKLKQKAIVKPLKLNHLTLKQTAIVKPLKLNHFTAAFIKFRFQTTVL